MIENLLKSDKIVFCKLCGIQGINSNDLTLSNALFYEINTDLVLIGSILGTMGFYTISG